MNTRIFQTTLSKTLLRHTPHSPYPYIALYPRLRVMLLLLVYVLLAVPPRVIVYGAENAEIGSNPQKKDKPLFAFFKRHEGELKVKAVAFQGSEHLSTSQLAYLVRVKERFYTDEQRLEHDSERLRRSGLFDKVSYQLERLSPKKVKVLFLLKDAHPFPRLWIQSIKVEGNKKTKAKTILRELLIHKGDELNWDTLEKGLIEVERLRIFKRVDIRIEKLTAHRAGSDTLTSQGIPIELIIEVEEARSQVGFIWPTYSSDNPDLGGFGPVGGYININFLGTGAWIGMGGMWAKNRVFLGGMYFPRLYRKDQDLSIGVGYGERDQDAYNTRIEKSGGSYRIKVSGLVSYMHQPLSNHLELQHFFAILGTDFEQIQGKVPALNAWGPLYSMSIAYDHRDDYLEPTRGLYPSLRFDVGSYTSENGETSYYFRYNPTFRGYLPLGKRHCVALQVRGGVANKDINYLGRYQLGGSNDLRGFPEWSIMGSRYFLTNLEYRFPILSIKANYGISGVLFYDMGQAWDQGDEDPLNKIYSAWGGGIRLLTGPIILRLDYGISPYSQGVYFYFNHLF